MVVEQITITVHNHCNDDTTTTNDSHRDYNDDYNTIHHILEITESILNDNDVALSSSLALQLQKDDGGFITQEEKEVPYNENTTHHVAHSSVASYCIKKFVPPYHSRYDHIK